MKNPFIGTGVALVTPFRKQETIDFSKLESLINNIINGGADYIVALGTTSEAATMTETERHALQDFIVDSVGGRCPIMLGLGGNNTLAVRDAIANTNFDGISGILSVAPYYNKPNQRGLAQHFKHRSQRQGSIESILGATEVGYEDERSTICQEFIDRGERLADAGVIGNIILVIHGDIKVNTDQCLTTGEIFIVY